MTNEETFQEVYNFAAEFIRSGDSPYTIAATFMIVGMQIYKSTLSEEEYQKMLEIIYSNRDKIQDILASEQYKKTLN